MADKGVRLPAEVQAEIVGLYQSGWSAKQISDDQNVSVATVYNTLQRMGVQRRTQKEWVEYRNERDRRIVESILAEVEAAGSQTSTSSASLSAANSSTEMSS